MNTGPRFYRKNPVYPHSRHHAEFQLIASGTACPWYEDDRDVSLDPLSPRLWVHAKQQVHGWRDTTDTPCEIAVFHFSALHPLMEDLLRSSPVLSIPVTREASRDILARAESAKALAAGATAENILTLEKLHLDLSILVLRNSAFPAKSHAASQAEQRVEEACGLYIGHLREQWTAERIARRIGLSPPHLRRMFLQVKGRPPKEVYTEIRMGIARRRLQLGQETLAELSEQLGFSEPSAFSRAYTRYYGHSPRRAGKLKP
ncbi:MAG: helix-turn-helix transcriptional regulator [Verrucomicrobia bacterium]|nr:helix-turn-helix transcriptional regulator [Verrucomicrobiota bacterium]MCH8527800.1 AraC family transcriptional regulator [Kiritimatiellia bacterium]